jgi:hypothetical protein
MAVNRCNLPSNDVIRPQQEEDDPTLHTARFVLLRFQKEHDSIYFATVPGIDFHQFLLRTSTFDETGQAHDPKGSSWK